MRALGSVASVLLIMSASTLHAAQASHEASLIVTVLDPAGARVMSAWLIVEGGTEIGSPDTRTHASGPDGIVVNGLEPGRYTIRVYAPGFAPAIVTDVDLRGHVRRTVRLELAHVSETVVVARERQEAALDPRGFSTFLSRAQIDALPDDPDEFARALQQLAPPGAVIRIDGFTGGSMPPKSQILSIRLPRLDSHAAQDHGGLSGFSYIDIVTTPGGGRLRGSADVALRHHALNARNPLAADTARESTRAGTVAFDGPLVAERASFAAAARVVHEEDAAAIHAALPDGTIRSEPIARPLERLSANGRVTVTMGAGQTLRAGGSVERWQARNQGVGDINLRERAFRSSSRQTTLRVSSAGALGRRGFLESRVQMRWGGMRSVSAIEAPAIRVLDAFASGGAQVAGGSRSFEVEAAADVDYARGAHAWRFGGLVEAGRYHSNRRTNYLGTFTFTSMEAYRAGAPASYTRRIGDPDVTASNLQIGLYAQDDYRAARSLLLSYGLRYERQALTGGSGRLLPRAGLAWSPFRSGSTTVRVGGGLYSDWVPETAIEQTRLLDGTRQHDILVLNPSFPELPDPDGAGTGLRKERYRLARDLRLASSVAFSAGLEQQIGQSVRFSPTYTRRLGWHLLRGRNLNAPVQGRRPDPANGNVIEAASDAGLRGHTVTMHVATTRVDSRWSVAMAYVYSNVESNTASPFTIPPTGRLEDEWGATSASHALSGTLTVRVTPELSLALQPQWRSGAPYTVTSGRDDNGDGLFTDRPPSLARNSERTSPYWALGVRLSYVVRVGTRAREDATGESGTSVSDAAGLTDDPQYRVELFASAQNVTNRANYVSVGSVMGSPLFRRPTVAINPRRLEVGVRFGF